MTENDKRSVILYSIEKQISNINPFKSWNINETDGMLTGIISDVSRISKLLDDLLVPFNKEITYNIALGTHSDLFALLTVTINKTTNLDNIIALLKLENKLDERVKHIFD